MTLDLAGLIFGRLTAVEPTAERRDAKVVWLCACVCGNTIRVSSRLLTQGKTRSCGCLRLEMAAARLRLHGAKAAGRLAPEYTNWQAMKDRCYNKNNNHFRRYGGRGIRVCDRWLKGENGVHPFVCFLKDMGPRPSPLHSTIDRFPNNDGDYEPTNCRWATQADQRSVEGRTA
jgi:hypothetical protein